MMAKRDMNSSSSGSDDREWLRRRLCLDADLSRGGSVADGINDRDRSTLTRSVPSSSFQTSDGG